ncbi:MAG: hypothetical protein BMS9Abin30_0855 [Gammaproteobacteria bacterium]|nr:MAG: hypothetical protein BMS9Abin30_0855 [Gammaproteobacteria bacterium]
MYICFCNAVTDSDIRTAVEGGVRNLKQLGKATGCSSACGSCKEIAVEVLEKALTEKTQAQSLLPMMQLA